MLKKPQPKQTPYVCTLRHTLEASTVSLCVLRKSIFKRSLNPYPIISQSPRTPVAQKAAVWKRKS